MGPKRGKFSISGYLLISSRMKSRESFCRSSCRWQRQPHDRLPLSWRRPNGRTLRLHLGTGFGRQLYAGMESLEFGETFHPDNNGNQSA
jgi:hypothetical protein